MTTTNEVDERALARNLLHAVLALAFPEEAAAAEQQQAFLAQLPQLKRVLSQRRVFALAASSTALAKFHTRLWSLLEQASDVRVRAAALELQLLVLQQCGLEQLEQLTPKLVERVIRIAKQQPVTAALTPALDVAAALVRPIELLTPEVRRDLYDSFTKLLPTALAPLLALGSAKSVLPSSDVQLWTSGVRLVVELLEVSPNVLRLYAAKIEQVCALLFQFPDAFAGDDANAALAVGAKCLGLLANASDKTPQAWKQTLDRAIEVVHVQVDLLSGKRTSGSAAAAPHAGARGWAKDVSATVDASLPVYQRAERSLQRFEIAAAAISESMRNRAVSEREVQLVLPDVLALVRRALAVRAAEIGKQTAVSEDGVRLPASVVYGVLPRVQELALRVLSAVVERAGVCALRHASKIVKVLRLASENGARDSHDALCAAIAVCVRSLGASTVEKLGVPLLDEMVTRCKADLANELRGGDSGATELHTSGPSVADKKGGGRNSSSKGKKRKRQAEGGVAQLAETADALPFVPSHAQLLLARSVDASLASIATLVAVYGATLPLEARAAASDVARVAVQQRARQKFLFSAASATTTTATSSVGMDAVALLLLADATSADSSGTHGANVVAGMRYWQEHARHAAVLNGATPLSTTLQLVALSAGDALLHPRAPPLSISFHDAVDATTATKQQQRLGGYATVRGTSTSATASGVRGRNDWNEEGEDDKVSESEADEAATMSLSKKRKADDAVDGGEEAVGGAKEEDKVADEANDDEEEEEEEEDYDDVRPTDLAPPEPTGDEEKAEDAEEKSVAVATATGDDDDDDDEFPDIVVDDADE